jgi:hypothetical protein
MLSCFAGHERICAKCACMSKISSLCKRGEKLFTCSSTRRSVYITPCLRFRVLERICTTSCDDVAPGALSTFTRSPPTIRPPPTFKFYFITSWVLFLEGLSGISGLAVITLHESYPACHVCTRNECLQAHAFKHPCACAFVASTRFDTTLTAAFMPRGATRSFDHTSVGSTCSLTRTRACMHTLLTCTRVHSCARARQQHASMHTYR